MPASPAQYFAPTYFSPFYFPPLVVKGGGIGGGGSTDYRDRDAFASIVAALEGTGEFASVVFAFRGSAWPGGANSSPVVAVTPEGWEESDETDPVLLLRRVFFSLTIVVRGEETLERYTTLDRLSCLAQNVLDGQDLGGGCIGALTKTRSGRLDPTPNFPEQSTILRGEFAYLIPGMAGHSVSF